MNICPAAERPVAPWRKHCSTLGERVAMKTHPWREHIPSFRENVWGCRWLWWILHWTWWAEVTFVLSVVAQKHWFSSRIANIPPHCISSSQASQGSDYSHFFWTSDTTFGVVCIVPALYQLPSSSRTWTYWNKSSRSLWRCLGRGLDFRLGLGLGGRFQLDIFCDYGLHICKSYKELELCENQLTEVQNQQGNQGSLHLELGPNAIWDGSLFHKQSWRNAQFLRNISKLQWCWQKSCRTAFPLSQSVLDFWCCLSEGQPALRELINSTPCSPGLG